MDLSVALSYRWSIPSGKKKKQRIAFSISKGAFIIIQDSVMATSKNTIIHKTIKIVTFQ